MVVGKGLIAQTLLDFKQDKNIIIFASGVSNSHEFQNEAFRREIDLLLTQDRDKNLVYFSTCSVLDPTVAETNYIRHKKKIENIIIEEFKNPLIVRLPTLVGKNGNPNTFFNHIKNKLINNEEIIIFQKAWRYLLDADDLKIIMPLLLKNSGLKNKIINVAYNNPMRVEEIVKVMENLLEKKSKKKIIEKGSNFVIFNNFFLNILTNNKITTYSANYNYNLISKYLLMC